MGQSGATDQLTFKGFLWWCVACFHAAFLGAQNARVQRYLNRSRVSNGREPWVLHEDGTWGP